MNPEELRLHPADSKGAFGGINLSNVGPKRGEKWRETLPKLFVFLKKRSN